MNRRGLKGPGRALGVRSFLRMLRKAHWGAGISFFHVQPDGALRAVHGQTGMRCCPITAVWFNRTGEVRDLDQTSDPARALRITPKFEEQIISAADHRFTPRSRKAAAMLRRRMLKALNLRDEEVTA